MNRALGVMVGLVVLLFIMLLLPDDPSIAGNNSLRDRVTTLEQKVADLEERIEAPVFAERVVSWCGPGEAEWEWRGYDQPARLSCSSRA